MDDAPRMEGELRLIRGSVQYIMIKIKMTSKFDDRVDAVEQTFYELLKWPQIDELNTQFPRARFNVFLRELPLN